MLFLTLSLALLFTPGPTNTILALGGALNGFRRSLILVPAELLGYLAAIHLLSFSIGPLIQSSPAAQTATRLLLSAYLIGLAVSLWRAPAHAPAQAVTPARVFTVTLLNPKALVFALVILPPLAGHWRTGLPLLAALSGLIVAASLCWIGLGALLGQGGAARGEKLALRRLAALVLTVFAGAISLPRLWALHAGW